MRHCRAPGQGHAEEKANAPAEPTNCKVGAAPVRNDVKAISTLPLLLFIS